MLNFMSTTRAQQLIEEIQDLTKQYHAEISSVRKPWPKSIKIRIRELFSLDIPIKKTAEQINIPYATIMSWKHPKRKKSNSDFHALTVRPEPTVTVRSSNSQIVDSNLTVTVRTSDGWTIEMPANIFSKLFNELRKGM